MLLMKNKTSRLMRSVMGLVLVLAIFTGMIAPVAAVQNTAVKAAGNNTEIPETVWSDAGTVISMQAGKSYYHYFGEKQYFDSQNPDYRPFYTGSELMVPAAALAHILDASVQYDAEAKAYTFTDETITAVVTVDAEVMYVNTAEVQLVNKAMNPGDMDLLPMSEVAKAFNRGVLVNDGIFVITHSQEIAEQLEDAADKTQYNTLMGQAARLQDTLLSEQNFDGLTSAPVYDNSNVATSKEIYSEGAWQGDSFAMSVVTESGKWSVATLPKISLDETARSYKLTFWAKVSSDFSGNNLAVHCWYYKDDQFVLRKALYNTNQAQLGSDWMYFEYTLDTYTNMSDASSAAITYDGMNESFADEFYFSVGLLSSGTSTAAGTIYLDNIQLFESDLVTENVHASFIADKTGAWYHPGDTITYEMPDPTQLNGYENFCATVLDADGNAVKSYTNLSVEDIQQNGFSMSANDFRPGYYEISMCVHSADGTAYPVAELYNRAWNTGDGNSVKIVTHELLKHSFVVADPSKTAENTNDLFMLSTSGSETELLLGREVGYSGVRLHTVNWGSTYSNQGFHTASGTFDWTRADSQIFGAQNAGYENIIANVFATPKWAAPEETWSLSGISNGNYQYNRYAPADLDNLKAGMSAFADRYGHILLGVEFWNEPMYGKTAFWVDSVDNFRAMSNAAAEAIEQTDPSIKFISAGFTHTSNAFFEELLAPQTAGLTDAAQAYANSLDGFSYHGYYGKYDNFKPTIETYGLTDILQIDSESYLYAYKQGTDARDWRINNMLYLSAMMYKVRDDLDMVAHFSLLDGNVNDQAETGYSTTPVYGLFSKFPYIEPHQGAYVQHFFMQQVGKEFTYIGEYDLGDGQKAVAFNNDGEPFVVLWNAKSTVTDANNNLVNVDKTFAISDTLSACFTENTTIIDYLNIPADADALKTMKMYYIKGLDATKLADLETSEGSALNADFQRPFYTCTEETHEVEEEISNLNSIPYYRNPNSKIFDETADVWTLNEGFELITTDWQWQPTVSGAAKPAGFNAAQLAYIDEDGFYLVMDVDDEEHSCASGDTTTAYKNNDSIQIAIDTVGRNYGEDSIELTICYLNGEVKILKNNAPAVDAMLPDGYTYPGDLMSSEYCQITKTDSGYRYMLFMPSSEMFPYEFPGAIDYVRVAFLANQNDGTGKTGYLEWASGLGGTKDASQYGAILFDDYEILSVWNDASQIVSAMAGQPYYMVEGTAYYYHENHTYKPHYTGSDLWLTADVLANMMKTDVSAISSVVSAKTTTPNGWKLYSLKEAATAMGKEVITNVRRNSSGKDVADSGVFVIVEKGSITDDNQKKSCHRLATAAYGTLVGSRATPTANEITTGASGNGKRGVLGYSFDVNDKIVKVSFWAKAETINGTVNIAVWTADGKGSNDSFMDKFGPALSTEEYRYFEFELSSHLMENGKTAVNPFIVLHGSGTGKILVKDIVVRAYDYYTTPNANVAGTLDVPSTYQIGEVITFTFTDMTQLQDYESVVLSTKKSGNILDRKEVPVSEITDNKVSMELTSGGSSVTLDIAAKSIDGTEYSLVQLSPTNNAYLLVIDDGTAYKQTGISIKGIGWNDIKGENYDQNAVISNLVLPSFTDAYEYISWTSSTPDVIAKNGTVTRPAPGQEDAVVVLTAKGLTNTYKITVTVKAEPYPVYVGTVGYLSLENAIANAKSGDVITLNENVTASSIIIPRGVTLDLSDYTLTADSVDGLRGSKITANINSGKLILGEGNKGNLGMPEDGYVLSGNYPVLPVWTGDGYVFDMFATTFGSADNSRGVFLANNTLRVQFATVCATDAIYSNYLSSNASNAGLQVLACISWDSGNATANQELVFKDDHIAKAISNDQVDGEYWDFTASVYGASALGIDSVDDLTGVSVQIVLDCGIVYEVAF